MSSSSIPSSLDGPDTKQLKAPISIPSSSVREEAIQEAQACLQAVEYEGYTLDGFNLLGVVANPRSGLPPTTPQPSRHATDAVGNEATRTTGESIAADGVGQAAAEESLTDTMFSGAVHSFEYTLAQVTEQIDSVNLFLEELSRHYLGDDGVGESLYLEYYYQDTEGDGVVLQPTPMEGLEEKLKLHELQAYLEKCGVLAHALFAQGLEPSTNNGVLLSTKEGKQELERELNEIPDIFFENDFDLTHSDTFSELLLQEAAEIEKEQRDENTAAQSASLYQSTSQLVPLKDQESLAIHLDRVELALQEQVRQKAGAFFQETTRFRQLQGSMEDLLRQVQTLRHGIQQILSVYSQTSDISNHQRQNYEQLVILMDEAMELVRCKASVGGLLSANDHLGAAEQIHYGRKMLEGMVGEPTDDDSKVDGNGTSSQNGNHRANAPLELQQLTALSTCGEQFKQYESLVVQNLSEELVDVFFHWRSGGSDKEHVQEMIQALNVCQALSQTGDLYQRRLQQTIRMTVRTTIAEFVEGSRGSGVTGMSYPAFYDCLEMLIEELQNVLRMSQQVDEFCLAENIFPEEKSGDGTKAVERWTYHAMTTGSDLASKSIAELLRLRKEAHSLITLDEMKKLWDTCLQFTVSVESYGDTKAVGLRSTLVGQAKAFLERTHESNMSSLVAALESERWTQCEVSSERQSSLTRLCTGRAIMSTSMNRKLTSGGENPEGYQDKKPTAEVEGVDYKVVWSCLLLVEMVMTNLSAAAHFQSLAVNAVAKVAELLRLFNTRATQLVLGAGAIHAAARLKSINARHLSMVTQCLGMMLALLPHLRAALMAQLPPKQHTLLSDLDRIKKEYLDHMEKVLNKFVTIIGGIVEHGLAPRIANTNFDTRATDLPAGDNGELACCVFLEGVSTNTRKMHQVLNSLLPPDHLQDVFSRIFAYVDQKVPTLFIAVSTSSAPATSGANNRPSQQSNSVPSFCFPSTDEGKRRLILEVQQTTEKLNGLKGVMPWEFTCMSVLERELDYKLPRGDTQPEPTNSDEGASKAEEPVANGLPKTPVTDDSSPGAVDRELESQGESGPVNAEEPTANGASRLPVEGASNDVGEEESANRFPHVRDPIENGGSGPDVLTN